MALCTSCGSEVDDAASFCTSCGQRTSLNHAGSTITVTRPICSSCGARVDLGSVFCTNCGQRMAQPAVIEETALGRSEPVPIAVAAPPLAVDTAIVQPSITAHEDAATQPVPPARHRSPRQSMPRPPIILQPSRGGGGFRTVVLILLLVIVAGGVRRLVFLGRGNRDRLQPAGRAGLC